MALPSTVAVCRSPVPRLPWWRAGTASLVSEIVGDRRRALFLLIYWLSTYARIRHPRSETTHQRESLFHQPGNPQVLRPGARAAAQSQAAVAPGAILACLVSAYCWSRGQYRAHTCEVLSGAAHVPPAVRASTLPIEGRSRYCEGIGEEAARAGRLRNWNRR